MWSWRQESHDVFDKELSAYVIKPGLHRLAYQQLSRLVEYQVFFTGENFNWNCRFPNLKLVKDFNLGATSYISPNFLTWRKQRASENLSTMTG